MKTEPDKAETDKTDSDITVPDERVTREPMTPIRRKIAAHLLKARQNTAMLTTFNEIDMSRAMALRQAYKEPFKEKHQVSLGYMSFFIKACIEALKQCPQVNAFVDGNDIVYHHYYHVGWPSDLAKAWSCRSSAMRTGWISPALKRPLSDL